MKLLLALMAFLLPLALAEALVRALQHEEAEARRAYGMRVYEAADGPLVFEKRANAYGYWETPEFSVHYHTNSRGWFDREYSPEELRSPANIVVLGDSFTSGHHAGAMEATFSKVMEREIQRTGQSVNVLNTGTSGYSTRDALAYYRHRIAGQVAHKTVLYMLYLGNDPVENGPGFQRTAFAGSLVFAETEIDWRHRAYAWLFHRSDVFVLHLRRASLPKGVQKRYLAALHEHEAALVQPTLSPPLRHDLAETFEFVREMSDEAERNGARFVAVLIPHESQVSAKSYPSDRFAPLRSLNECPGFDLVGELRSEGAESLYLRLEDHMNARGHEVVGRFLATEMMACDRGLQVSIAHGANAPFRRPRFASAIGAVRTELSDPN